MKALLASIFVLLALLACKKAGTQPPQNSGPVAPVAAASDAGASDAPNDASAPIFVECDGDAGTCYEQANAACPNGFDELEKSEAAVEPVKTRSGAPAAEILKPKITRPGGNPPPVMRTRLTVRCREPAPAEDGGENASDASAGDADAAGG